MLRRLWMAPLLALALAGLVLGGCKSDEETTATPVADNSVTLSGTLQVAAAPAGAPAGQALSSNPADYVLYCVTFTSPPQSGTGAFDASGNFSVTLTAAAGLPVGCFINDAASNASVTTITFIVGSGLSGTSGSVALDPGTYTITISFDPVSGTATADVSQTTQAPVAANFQPDALVGTWRLNCVDTDPAGRCVQMLEAPSLDIYLDVITATEGANTLYAMGVWKSRQTFIDLGATEAIPAKAIPPEITNVVSLNTDVTTPAPSATAPFLGFTAQTGYDVSLNQISGTDALAALAAVGWPYDPTFNDAMLNGGVDNCTAATPDLTQEPERRCLVDFLRWVGDQWPGDAGSNSIPRVGGATDYNFNFTGPDGNALIDFMTTKLGGSPAVYGRHALMDLGVVGDTGVAKQFEEFTYSKYDSASGTQVMCTVSNELTITMTITGAATAVGVFSEGDHDTCSTNGGGYATFEVTFDKL